MVRRLKGRGGEEEPSPTSVHNRLTSVHNRLDSDTEMLLLLLIFLPAQAERDATHLKATATEPLSIIAVTY